MVHTPEQPPGEVLLPGLIPNEYAQQIARIVSGFAQLEYDIDIIIWELAGLADNPDIGACLTAQIGAVVPRMEALISLAHLRNIPEIQITKLNKFKERIRGIGERRHRVAHDPWLSSFAPHDPNLSGRIYRLQKTAKSKLEHAYKRIEITELQNLNHEIWEATWNFSDLGIEILHIFRSLP